MSSRIGTPPKASPGVSFDLGNMFPTPSSTLLSPGSIVTAPRSTILNSKRESNIRHNRLLLTTPMPDRIETMHTYTPNISSYDGNNDNSLMILPPSQTISESLTALAHSTSKELEEIWDKIGLSPEERADQLTDLLASFRQVCDQKVSAEREVSQNYQQMIVDYKTEIRTTSLALKVPANKSILRENTGQTLQDEVYTLEVALDDLRNVANVARTELAAYSQKLVENHKALGMTLEDDWKDVESDLTLPRVELFRDKVETTETLLATRTSAVIQLIRDCQELMNELRIDSSTEMKKLDKQIMGSLIKDDEGNIKIVSKLETDECTGVSANTIDALTNRISELHSEKRSRQAKLSEMGTVIFDLWEKLHVPREEQKAFQDSLDKLGMQTLAKGERELARLYKMKEEMMGRLIVDARKRIQELWEETNATVEQKSVFKSMDVEDEGLFNDDLLSSHENYIQLLNQRLEQMRPIIESIEKREAIIGERTEYEKFLKDPNRLQQRGAALTRQLMKEERMSRRIKKDLPKYTDHLKKKLKDWSQSHEEPFLYKGEDYLFMMKRQEEMWLEYKEGQAQMKRQKKQEERTTSNGLGRNTFSTSSSISSSSAPLADKTNRNDSRPRAMSRFRAKSRGKEREGDEESSKQIRPKPRGKGMLSKGRARPETDKNSEMESRNASRGRGILSRIRARPSAR